MELIIPLPVVENISVLAWLSGNKYRSFVTYVWMSQFRNFNIYNSNIQYQKNGICCHICHSSCNGKTSLKIMLYN